MNSEIMAATMKLVRRRHIQQLEIARAKKKRKKFDRKMSNRLCYSICSDYVICGNEAYI